MPSVLTFVIPVRHPENAHDWAQLKRRLSQTLASIASQTHPDWRCIVVANSGADLPKLPQNASVAWVDYPPNPLHDTIEDREAFYDAVRLDKGRRILAGLRQVQIPSHVMVVDDDDFVHRDLADYVSRYPSSNGWFILDGYLWDEGRLLYQYRNFSHFCGTSHIIRSDLYRLPPADTDVDDAFIRRTLGSHTFIADDLAASGTPLEPLPFRGAIYRIGHRGAHSKSQTILRKFFFSTEDGWNLPRRLRRLIHLRPLRASHLRDFFGSGT